MSEVVTYIHDTGLDVTAQGRFRSKRAFSSMKSDGRLQIVAFHQFEAAVQRDEKPQLQFYSRTAVFGGLRIHSVIISPIFSYPSQERCGRTRRVMMKNRSHCSVYFKMSMQIRLRNDPAIHC